MAPDFDVAVAGLGPVGAVTALLLARRGLRVVALERTDAPCPDPRAVALDDEAVRVLQAAGVPGLGPPLLLPGAGVRFTGARGQVLLDVPMPPEAYGHPALSFVHQPDLVAVLWAELRRRQEVELRLGAEVSGVRAGAGGAALELAGGGEVSARWVLACDGARSRIRRAAGIPLRGLTSSQRWLVVDGRLEEEPGEPFVFACDPRGPAVTGPLPGGRRRWELMLRPGSAAPSAAALAGSEAEVERAAVYAFHARIAARWRRGRVLLLGDAAHLSPPFAGQGLSAGLRDAGNLTWKLAEVVREESPEALLDSYEAERRPHVRRMLALAAALGTAIQTTSAPAARARDLGVAALAGRSRVEAWLARGGWKPPATLARGHLGPGGGALLPQPRIDGRLLDEVLGPGWAEVGVGVDAPVSLPVLPGLAPWAGRRLTVRPDRYVYAATPAPP